MVNFVDQIFPVLLKTLSDTSDEVLILNLQVLAEICCPPNKDPADNVCAISKEDKLPTPMALEKVLKKRDTSKNDNSLVKDNATTNATNSAFGNTNPHFRSFILSLLKLFRADRNLLDTKGSFIIR